MKGESCIVLRTEDMWSRYLQWKDGVLGLQRGAPSGVFLNYPRCNLVPRYAVRYNDLESNEMLYA